MTEVWHRKLARLFPESFGPMSSEARHFFSPSRRWLTVVEREGKPTTWLAWDWNEDAKTWAEVSLMADGPIWNPAILHAEGEAAKGLRDPRLIWLRFGIWGRDPRPEDWARRYPSIPFELRVEFIYWHEVGHLLRGSKESAADEFACEKLGLEYRGLPEGMADVDHEAEFLRRVGAKR